MKKKEWEGEEEEEEKKVGESSGKSAPDEQP